MKVINVQGRRKTGKTTTVTSIIGELVKRGYSVGSIKGIHIDDFTLDSDNEDTGKHRRAGADPVTARCHGETDIMFGYKMGLEEILSHYSNDWVVIESHVDLSCPNVVTGLDLGGDKGVLPQINEYTIAVSGIISNDVDSVKFTATDAEADLCSVRENFLGQAQLPVISAVTDIERLVDLIEEKTFDYVPSKVGSACSSTQSSDSSIDFVSTDFSGSGRVSLCANNPVSKCTAVSSTTIDIEGSEKPDSNRATGKSSEAEMPMLTTFLENQKEVELVGTDTQERIFMSGHTETVEYDVLNESQIDLYGREAGSGKIFRIETLPCSPQYPVELALGWLLAEGYITSPELMDKEIASVEVNQAGSEVTVTFMRMPEVRPGHATVSPVRPIVWNPDCIFETGAITRDNLPLRRRTGTAHYCYLARPSYEVSVEPISKQPMEILFACEDTGRHSAMDKCIGWGIRNHIDMKNCFLFASGRISGGMAQKAIRAGIPVLIGKAMITRKSASLARENHLTLIGYGSDYLRIFNRG